MSAGRASKEVDGQAAPAGPAGWAGGQALLNGRAVLVALDAHAVGAYPVDLMTLADKYRGKPLWLAV